ncbi:MAG: alpha/beta hydrolase [Christensenellales bacterium]|jgi:fermentation-respiration switch protein FrsA (DUF1100 family)
MSFKRIDCQFESHKDKCSAWLYLPNNITKPPLIIMAHGLAGMKNCGLEPFAEFFASNGLAVLSFDYRGFADSEGTPRQLISPKRHVEDYLAAINWARTREDINTDKIALWGSSFSGGHVIKAAARDPKIAAISAQVPFVSGRASSTPIVIKNGPKYLLKAIVSCFRDIFRAATGSKPYTVPVYGYPNEFAILNTPDSRPGYESLIPEGMEVVNAAPARIFLTMILYHPTNVSHKINCPALVIAGENDSLIPIKSVKKAVSKMKDAKLVSLPIGHFDPYFGENFEIASKQQLNFINSLAIKEKLPL